MLADVGFGQLIVSLQVVGVYSSIDHSKLKE